MSRVTHLSLSRSLFITFVLVLYRDTGCEGQDVTLTRCGFEAGNLCGYSQFNWTIWSGATPTADTGPPAAYEGSYYLYIDAGNTNEGDKAVLQTPGVYWTGLACVSLAYHMYGEDIGTLTLSLPDTVADILHKTGNQGNVWIKERIDFSITNGTSFVIEGIRGSGDKGDIAIDDFSVVTGTCKPTVSLLYSCSFESDFCGMWQSGFDLDWLRTRKDNATPETGSPGDSGGDWVISLASDGQDREPSAIVATPRLNFTGDICVKFKYYLSSSASNVRFYSADDAIAFLRYSAATGPKWRSVSLTVRSFVRNNDIYFWGSFYGKQAASMALDEISISTDICDDCAVYNGGCNQTCSRTDTGRTCSCHSGYGQVGETGCQDIDECLAGTDACSHVCQNEAGRYTCHCPAGWSLMDDGYTCQDIDECAADTDKECDHVCINVEGSYNCSCRVNYILATDGRHCIECESTYERSVAASQLLTSDCPTTSSHPKITLDDCFLEACSKQTGVIAYFNMVCNLKLCDGSNLLLNTVSGSTGWDIYVLNTTWPGSINSGNPDAFPLVAVVAGVVVPVILLVVIVTAVVFIMRRRGLRERRQSVQHVNDAGQPASVGEVRTPPINENQTEVGIYDEVMETPERQAAVTNTPVTYRNAAFQGAHQYLDLDLGVGEYLTPTPKQQAAVTNTQVAYMNAAFQGEHQCQDLDLGLGESLTPTPKQHDDVQ